MMWKVVAAILNHQLTASITFHDFLYGFRVDCGTGTAKLLQYLAALREEVLCIIFLELHKVYDALDRSRCLEILKGYGVGPRACRILRTYWIRLRMVAKAGGYYGAAFTGDRGVMQRDPLPPTIFNVVVDALV